METRLYTV